jgi:hypothetical protein
MQRRAATTLHLALSVLGIVLYVLFVLPRWWVLTGDFPDTLAIVGRVAAGVPIALAAVPVMLNLRQSIKPESGIPELALRLRAWSAVLHMVAGVLIILTAIAEIGISIDAAGPWLFAVYGAAAAIAVLGIAAYYLSAVAEKPPAAEKPAKPLKEKAVKERTWKRGRKTGDEVTAAESTTVPDENADENIDDTIDTTVDTAVDTAVDASSEDDVTTADSAAALSDAAPEVVETEVTEIEAARLEDEPTAADVAPEADGGALRNKRPTGKSRHRLPR